MNYLNLKKIEKATNQLLSLSDAKKHLSVSFDDDDMYITDLIDAANDLIETELGISLLNAKYRYTEVNRTNKVELFSNVQEITKVFYIDDDLNEVELNSYRYDADVFPIVVSLPASYQNLKIEFIAGFGEFSSDVKSDLIHAAKLLIGNWYENRQILTDLKGQEIPYSASVLIQKHRVV